MGKSKAANNRCWFSKLSVEQVVALAEAVGMTGCDLVTRLHAHPLAAPYGMTFKAPVYAYGSGSYYEVDTGEASGLSVEELKALCHARGLPTGGTRFALVHALLTRQHEEARAAKKHGSKHKAEAEAPRTADSAGKAKRRRV